MVCSLGILGYIDNSVAAVVFRLTYQGKLCFKQMI